MTDQEDPARNRIDEANGSGETETYGPAYQRLRETLRELIGETDAEEVDREAGARTRRRRGYVEPERAGVLRQSDGSDQSAVAREGAGDAHYGPEGERDSDDRPALSGEQAPSEASGEPADEPGEAALPARSAAGLQRIIRSRPRQRDAGALSDDTELGDEEAGGAPQKSAHSPRTLASALRRSDAPASPAGHSGAVAGGSGVDRYLEPEPAPIPVSRKPIGQLARSRRRKSRTEAEMGAAAAGNAKLAERDGYGGRSHSSIDEDDVNDDDALWHGKAPVAASPGRSSKVLLLAAAFGVSVLVGAGIYLGAVMGRAPSPPTVAAAKSKPAAEVVVKSAAGSSPAAVVAADANNAEASADPAADQQSATAESVETVVAAEPAATPDAKPADVLPSAALEVDPPVISAKPQLPAKPAAEPPAIDPVSDPATEALPKPVIEAAEPEEVATPSAVGAIETPAVPKEQVAAAAESQPVERSVPVGSSEPDATADEASPVDDAADAAAEPETAAADQIASAGDAAAAQPAQPSAPVGSGDSSVEQVGILTTAPPVATDGCEPSIEVFPRPAGFSRISVRSECRKDELVRFTYGGVVYSRRLDANGALDVDIDCFLGLSHAVDIAFKDGSVYEATLVADDIDKVAKIAVVWNQTIDLDLHAFEDGAPFNDPRHLWNSRPGSYAAALQAIASSGRGHGFLSSIADSRGSGSRFEVYTYLYPPQRNTGFVKFSVDYQTRGARPFGASCGDGAAAKPGFQVIYTIRGGQAVREFSEFAAVPCGQSMTDAVRFTTDLLPELNVAK